MHDVLKPRFAKAAPRWRVPTVVALLVAIAGVLPAHSGGGVGVHRPPVAPMSVQSTPVVIYPVTRFQATGGQQWALYTDTFSADSLHGWRYTVEITNHNAATGATIVVNYCQFVGTSEFGSGVSSLTRTIDVVPGDNDLQVSVKGPSSAYIEVRILRSPEPAYKVFGRTDYVSTGTSWTRTDSFPSQRMPQHPTPCGRTTGTAWAPRTG
jgi:hypothetical protein